VTHFILKLPFESGIADFWTSPGSSTSIVAVDPETCSTPISNVVSPSKRMVYVTIYTLLVASAESIVSSPS
jgi:hypothetical protein